MIIKKTGPVPYQITVEHDRLWKRHADQLRHRVEECVTDTKNKEENSPETTVEKVLEIILAKLLSHVFLRHDLHNIYLISHVSVGYKEFIHLHTTLDILFTSFNCLNIINLLHC